MIARASMSNEYHARDGPPTRPRSVARGAELFPAGDVLRPRYTRVPSENAFETMCYDVVTYCFYNIYCVFLICVISPESGLIHLDACLEPSPRPRFSS